MSGKVYSLNISEKKGVSKYPIPNVTVIEKFGFENDAHAGHMKKQVSLLSLENIQNQNRLNTDNKVDLCLKPGDYAENITTIGMDLKSLKIGDKLLIGSDVVLQVSNIGKECHHGCQILKKMKSCIMPKDGIFTIVVQGGKLQNGDEIGKVQND